MSTGGGSANFDLQESNISFSESFELPPDFSSQPIKSAGNTGGIASVTSSEVGCKYKNHNTE